MVTPLEKFLAKHPTPSGMDSKEWAALNAAMKENKFFSSKVENIRLQSRTTQPKASTAAIRQK